MANETIILSLFKEKIRGLTSKNMEIIFTDGSVSENFTVSAFVHLNSNSIKSFYTDKKLSSLTAELTALEKAIDFSTSKKFSKIAILTDSLGAIQTIKNANSKNCISQCILKKVIKNPTLLSIEFHHIPSHSNIWENDLADSAAKNSGINGSFAPVRWTLKDAINHMFAQIKQDWEREYSLFSLERNKGYSLLSPYTTSKPWFKNKEDLFNRIETKTLNRILSGHAFDKYTLSKRKVYDNALCDSCNVNEDISHILINCSKYTPTRQNYPTLLKYNDIYRLLGNEPIENWTLITGFIRAAHINIYYNTLHTAHLIHYSTIHAYTNSQNCYELLFCRWQCR